MTDIRNQPKFRYALSVLGCPPHFTYLMNRSVFIVLFSLSMAMSAYSQSMSDTEVVKYAVEARKAGTPEADIAKALLQRGATMAQLQLLRKQYDMQADVRNIVSSPEGRISEENRMRKNNAYSQEEFEVDSLLIDSEKNGKKVFGRDIFNNKSLTFEPQMNIATPQNYVLGPGDQVIIDVYGASQESLTLTVSPDGDVTIPEYGPIHISGLTMSAAQKRIRSKLGSY